jgi:signal peptidase II
MRVLLWAIGIAFLDQATKYGIRVLFALGESVPVIPGLFELTYVRNTGAAWGIFRGFNLGLALLSVIVLSALLIWRRHFWGDSALQRVAGGLIVGGILGNLYDRLRLGYVVDFLHLYHGEWSFPAFNVADSAICVGVILYLWSAWRPLDRRSNES